MSPSSTPSTYAYLFTWKSPGWDGKRGGSHEVNTPFVFGTYDIPDAGGFALAARSRLTCGAAGTLRRAMHIRNFGRVGASSALSQGAGDISGTRGPRTRDESVAGVRAAVEAGLTLIDGTRVATLTLGIKTGVSRPTRWRWKRPDRCPAG